MDLMSSPGAGVGREIAGCERAEAELDAFISRRASADHGTTADEREEGWKASARAHHARRRREARALWFAHFCRMADSHARISRDYKRRAEELCQEGA